MSEEVKNNPNTDVWKCNIKCLFSIAGFVFCFVVGIALSNELAKVLEEEMDPSIRKHNLNLVKMMCYLLCQYMEMLESDETKPGTNQVITKV